MTINSEMRGIQTVGKESLSNQKRAGDQDSIEDENNCKRDRNMEWGGGQGGEELVRGKQNFNRRQANICLTNWLIFRDWVALATGKII